MIETIITSSILIVLVALCRIALRGRVSRRLQYALWLIVLIRLLWPFGMIGSPVSVLNVIPTTQTVAVQPTEISVPTDITLPQEAGPLQPGPNTQSMSKSFPWKTLWLTGSLLMIAWFSYSNLKLALRLRRSRTLHRTGSKLPVYLSRVAPSPCLFGLVHPAIYLSPDVVLGTVQEKHAIEHEMTHYQQKDQWWSLLRGLALCLHWFNPLVWLAASLSIRDGELACDEITMQRLGESERPAYGRTLIELTQEKRPDLLGLATTMTGTRSAIHERIHSLTKKTAFSKTAIVAVMLLSLLIVSCTFTGRVEPTTDPEQLEWMLEQLVVGKKPFDLSLSGQDKSYAAWGAPNDVYLGNQLVDGTYEAAPNASVPEDLPKISLSSEDGDGKFTIDFFQGSDLVVLTRGRQSSMFQMKPDSEFRMKPGDVMRVWFDEAEFQALLQTGVVIEDTGQDYLAAAQAFAEAYERKHLEVAPGSIHKYSYLNCTVEAVPESVTQAARDRGDLDENGYVFALKTVFVPENEAALNQAMAGNTGPYTGNDPTVPEGAWEYTRFGYIGKFETGWGTIRGTSP